MIFCPIYGCAAEVLVLIDFEGTMSDELTVKMGDVVKNVTKASEEGWLLGELNGKRGLFPSNFVKVGEQLACSLTLPLVVEHSVLCLRITGGTSLSNGRQQEGTAKP